MSKQDNDHAKSPVMPETFCGVCGAELWKMAVRVRCREAILYSWLQQLSILRKARLFFHEPCELFVKLLPGGNFFTQNVFRVRPAAKVFYRYVTVVDQAEQRL